MLIPLRIFRIHLRCSELLSRQNLGTQGKEDLVSLLKSRRLQTTLCFWRAVAATGLHPELALHNWRDEPRPGFPHKDMDVGSSGWASCGRWYWEKIRLFQLAEGGRRSTGWKPEKPQTRSTVQYLIGVLLIKSLCMDLEQLHWSSKPDAEARTDSPVLFILISDWISTTGPTDSNSHQWKRILETISFHLCHTTEISLFFEVSSVHINSWWPF